jgi:ubiquinone/menaquinone biosynthesis C-methylase UbiE
VAGASLGVDEWRRAAVGVVRGLAWPERAVGQAATAPAVAHALDDTLGLLPDPQALATLLAVGEDAEPPAATAAFLDLVHRWVAAAFARQVDDFEDHIQRGDGRFAFLMREAGPLAARRVLDAGCGRGALTRAMLTAEPSALLTALDLSPAMLACLPLAARAVPGSLQSLPFPDASFDVAFAVESLEHAANPEGAVDELCRVVRPGGRVLIVDKNAQRAGVLPVEAWESWFHRDEVEAWLCRHCASVRSTPLVHCPELGVDLFVGWSGTRC